MNHSKDRQAISYINGRLYEITYEIDLCESARRKERLEKEWSALLTAKDALVSRIPIFANENATCFEVGHRRCPCCNASERVGANYCSTCGQALKWKEDSQ